MSESIEKLSEARVEAELKLLPEWSEVSGVIQRTFQFKDFAGAISFINRVAKAADRADHHPDMLIRYNKVTMTLSTHDAGGLTARDFTMGKQIDALASG